MSELFPGLDHHLPVLIVLLPLFGGLLSIFMHRFAWLWATAVTSAIFACSIALLDRVNDADNHIVDYFLGGWPAEWGIGYRVDPLNAYVILVISLISLAATIYSRDSVKDEISDDRHHHFYSVWLLAIAGLIGITVTGDTFNVYVLLEISSLTVYTLIAMGAKRDRRALTAALKYLILGSIGATFILLGIGYLLMLTGTLNMADMADVLAAKHSAGELLNNRTVLVAFAFLMVGLSLKMALFPLHMWLPNAYTYAPSAVSVLVASTATKVGVYMAFRFVFTIFGSAFAVKNLDLLTLCACLGIVVSSLAAIRQNNVKRILAYSSVGQLAYIVLGFSLANESGVTASIIHIFNHAVIKGAMFMAVGAVVLRVGSSRLSDFRGLGRRMPLTMGAFTLGGFGLIGLPLTAGFVSKWFLVVGALNRGYWWIAFVVLLGGVLALIYVWRVVEVVFFGTPEDPDRNYREAPLTMLIPMWTLIALSLYFGVNAEFTSQLAENAAMMLLGGKG